MSEGKRKPVRITEREIGTIIAEKFLIHRKSRTATVTECKTVLPRYVQFSAADQARSPSRPREQLWQQRVGNLVSHRDKKTNLIMEGLLEYLPATQSLRLTPDGEQELQRRGIYPPEAYSQA